MSTITAIPPILGSSLEEVQNSVGITDFFGGSGWHQSIGGLVVQGNRISGVTGGATVAVTFNIAFKSQILGVYCQPISASIEPYSINSVTLTGFNLLNGASGKDFYWFAVGA